MNHTKEPWIIDSDRRRGANLIRGDKAKMVAWTIYFDNGSKTELANAKRIVACVNACAGITNEALEAGVVACGVNNLRDNIPEGNDQFYFDNVKVFEEDV